MTGGRWSRPIGAAWLVGLTLSLLILSGCTHTKSPPASLPPTTTPSTAPATTPPTITPPTAPKPERTQKGAEAFVRYFWAVYNYSYAAKNTSLLRALSRPKCIFCGSTSKAIEDLVNKNQKIEGSSIQLEAAAAPPSDPSLGLIVTTIISEKPGKIVSADGSTINRTAGVRDMKSEVAIDWAGANWLVRDIANDEKTGKSW